MDQRLRMTHDAEADAAYIYLVENIPRGSVALSNVLNHHTPGASVTLDFDGRTGYSASSCWGSAGWFPGAVLRAADEVAE